MADKFVSLTGSDSNSGTISSPYLTWSKGLQNVGLGDFVYIRGGTYSAKVSNPTGITWGTQESERITLMPYDNESVTLKTSGDHSFHLKGDIAYFTLKDITIDGANMTGGVASQMVKIWTQGAVDVQYVTLDGLVTQNAVGHNIQFDSQSDNITVKNCTMLNWGQDPLGAAGSNAIYGRGTNYLIENNTIGRTDTPGANDICIRLLANGSDESTDSSNAIIRNNYCYGANYGIVFGGGDDMRIYNNLIRAAATLAIEITGNSGTNTTNAKVYHNTLVHATAMTHGVRVLTFGSTVTDSLVRNNIIRRATTAIDVSQDTGTPVTTDNYTGTAPGFANDGGTAVADYILTGTPATKDAGADLRSIVATDYYGNTRDATPDQGFFEMVDPANPEVSVAASYSGNKSQNITFDPQATDEDGDAVIMYIDRRDNTSLSLTFTAGTSTVEGG